MFKDHDKKMKKLLSEIHDRNVLEDNLSLHRTMLKRIQHERLIHLLVTFFVGISMVLVSLTNIVTESPQLLLLTVPLIVLFVAYIFHYRFLENTTQEWYKIEDDLERKIKRG